MVQNLLSLMSSASHFLWAACCNKMFQYLSLHDVLKECGQALLYYTLSLMFLILWVILFGLCDKKMDGKYHHCHVVQCLVSAEIMFLPSSFSFVVLAFLLNLHNEAIVTFPLSNASLMKNYLSVMTFGIILRLTLSDSQALKATVTSLLTSLSWTSQPSLPQTLLICPLSGPGVFWPLPWFPFCVHSEWIKDLTQQATENFLRGLALGVELNEPWIVCSAGAYIWNYNTHVMAQGRHREIVDALTTVLGGLKRVGHAG